MRFLIKVATVVLVASALVTTAPATAEVAAGPTVLAIATVSGSAGSLATS
jgi:hypothetical protein